MMTVPTPVWRNDGKLAVLETAAGRFHFQGRWISGGLWERFGLYNRYAVVRDDGKVRLVAAHAGELVPGGTEDLVAALRGYSRELGRPECPMTLELDPTWACSSRDCGGSCFSHVYRRTSPTATIEEKTLVELLTEFAAAGGRIVRFDGGGDPLSHDSVRSGMLPELAARLCLKSTILTSGDLLSSSNLRRIAATGCYVRVSVNAATDATRRQFHGNSVRLADVFSGMEQLARLSSTPVGATFLLGSVNSHEVRECAERCRDIGVAHFSVRRVLGPSNMRPTFSREDASTLQVLLLQTAELHSETFRVFIPWRPVDQPDLSPAGGDFHVGRCWQSTFKTVIEPDARGAGLSIQLCGRYRGGGLGQAMQLPPLSARTDGAGWVEDWRRSFVDYALSREELPQSCTSCIDRGFLQMVDSVIEFIEDPRSPNWHLLHLWEDSPAAQ